MAKKIVWLLVFLFFTVNLFSQTDAQIDAFNTSYYNSINKLRELEMTKGANQTSCDLPEGTNFYSNVKYQIGEYERNAANTSGVLYYSYNSSVLQVWLIGTNTFAYEEVKVSPEELKNADINLRAALNTIIPTQSRAPINKTEPKRGGIELLAEALPQEVSVSDAIKKLTNILLPNTICKGLTGLKQLFIVPEFNIGQIPFYVLQPYGNASYLVDSIVYTFTPHLCNFDAFVQKRGYIGDKYKLPSWGKALVVGDPEYSSTQYSFVPLPAAREEAKAIAKSFNTQPLIGKEATKQRVINEAERANFLYFATHGVFDYNTILNGSFIAFTPDSSDDTGFWTAKEIQNSYLSNAEMAVLSACQTGVGKIYEAGFVGIGSAFYKAGVDNTIVSLWSVDDKATKQLMEIFIEQLKQPQYFYPAENLRQAILKFKKQDANPAHWASFVNFGFCY